MKITRSKFNTGLISLNLTDELVLNTWGPVHISFGDTNFFPSSFFLTYADTVIYIDPLCVDTEPKADYILITHNHADHLSREDIDKIMKDNTKLIAPRAVLKKLKGYNNLIEASDMTLEKNIKIETVHAYSKGFPSHPKFKGFVGYVINLNGYKLYHAGDTDLVDEMSAIKDLNLALVPIDGGALTMKTIETLEFINRTEPKQVIPMHYMINKGKADLFKNGLVQEDRCIILVK